MSNSNIVSTSDGSKQLVTFNKIQQKVVRQNIHSEDEYLSHIGSIIQRDFFPDLAELKGEAPADEIVDGFETPPDPPTQNPQRDVTSVRLDTYLANNTTEDNASFIEIIEESERKREAKLAKFFPSRSPASGSSLAIATSDAPLAIKDSSHPKTQITPRPNIEQSTKQEPPPSVESITSHNTVHFIPDGAPLTAQELTEHFDRERRICPANSRFKRPMVPVMDKRKLVGMGGQLKAGRFGIDGKEVTGTEGLLATPQAGGYKFMDTSASPALSAFSGPGSTPLMTWGEVDSTPYRLDEETGHTPLVSSFRLPSPSKREALAHQLADKAGRQRAKVRAEAMKLAKSGLLLSPYAAKMMLSPAAKRLLSTTTGSSSGGKLAFGGCPNSSVRVTPLGLTPRRLPSDIGIIRRPPTSSSVSKLSTPRRERDGGGRGLENSVDLTKDLLNLSGSKSATSPTSEK
ncbi:unnamed protein product [Taenia asiatica]|uniref:DGCR14 n=1 Tax=Taenia asiatica TaxID=60517 RepID=A0A0R3WEK6_TAEAS|nr:unnamed protein product [Taenia asiatica]